LRLHGRSSTTLVWVLWASLGISCGGNEPNQPVATVTVTPPSSAIVPDETVQLAATAKDANGATLVGRTITWSSGNSAVATVSTTGLVTGAAAGDVMITASSEGKSGSAAVTVQTELPGHLCTDYRCARVVGTVRDVEGLPVAGATVAAIPAIPSSVVFETNRLAETDAAGRFQLEVQIVQLSNEPPPPLETFAGHVRVSLDLAGEAAVDTSALTPLVFALPERRTPVDTIDLVIDRTNTLPRPGSRIVYVHDLVFGDSDFGDLYVINADGSGRRPLLVDPTTDVDPAWTPDGQVLFTNRGESNVEMGLSLIEADGTNLRPFAAGLLGSEPRWAPDGKHVAFLAGYTDDTGVFRHQAGVWIANPDGTGPYRLPTRDDQLCEGPFCSFVMWPFGWYPDADRIGYTAAIATESGGLRTASYTTRLSDTTIAPIVGAFPLSWAPDGSRFLAHDFNLVHIRAPDGTPLATIPVGSGTITGAEAVWSPDSEWFAYVFNEEPSGRYQLWIADRDGNRRRRIALDAEDPDWQPTPAALR
jgi:Big-like domain-containing protein/WD40 repeat protein